MNTVECPSCTLRFEPAEDREIFCPQCGTKFLAPAESEAESEKVAHSSTAGAS
jgi:uncharacterized Zn finger protein (UPF0148 family)